MFCEAKCFNQPIVYWYVSNVTYMNYMFYGATDFNQDLRYWNISSTCTFENFTKNLPKFCKILQKFYRNLQNLLARR